VKEKEYNILLSVNCLVKNLTRKTQWDKTMVKEKRVQNTFISPLHEDKYLLDGEDQFLIQSFSKTLLGSYFVKTSARLSHERIC